MKESRQLADRFRLRRAIGLGGATEAWLAEDGGMDELVTLRLLAAPLVDRWETLREACRRTRCLAHPHIARVFDFHRSEEGPFLSREYVAGVIDGPELAGRPADEVLSAFAAVAASLEYAHAQGVVHGDLKHSKILRDAYGHVRVIDFCVASALRTAASQAGIDIPSGAATSPQVRAGDAPAAADDIYSLGTLVAGTLGAVPAPKQILDLVEAMRADQRAARPSDLGEIRQAFESFAVPEIRVPGSGRAMSVSAPASVASALPAAARRAETPSRNLQYVAALGLLGLVALAVVFWLPRWVDRGVERDPVPESEMVAEELPGVAEERGTSRADVETVLAKVLSAREGLEGQAVDRWASDRFAEAKQLESAGDTALIEAAHDTARTRYAEALELLEELSSESGSVLASSLESGLAAIEAGDSQRATEQFALALAIDPGNEQASKGARRAETLAEVLDYMSSGERLEAAGDTVAAADAYAKALALDSQWAPARVALHRAKAHRAVAEYEQNLSVGLVALARGDLASARSHLERARELQPTSPEIADGLRQLRQAETSGTITSRRRRAEDAERAEKWNEAAAHYQAILDAQGNLAFAEEGLSRSRDLSRISEGIDALLADPRQLFRPDTLEGARKLMADGQRVAEGKPELAGQVRNLGIAIRLASTPIPVEFRSDRETEVVIRKVGTLGNFDRREVPLKPGRYVVIGRRNGFRDVRREISVNPGAQPPVVDVRCTDEI